MRPIRTLLALTGLMALTAPPVLASEALLAEKCGACHATGAAGLTRIEGQRKTPEGWLMTIVRMRIAHGMEISGADQAALVAYLSETQGLAPSETEGFRYALERDPNAIEGFEEPFGTMCARCHTGARAMLQRRTPEEWLLHMDFHVGQFPTIEYQALGRDRDWYQIARTEIAPMLEEMLPFRTAAWANWQAAEKKPPTGDWIVLTSLPGRGDAHGRLTVSGDAAPYGVAGELSLADGSTLPVAGQMNLYTGYEWRANLSIGEEAYRQVLSMEGDGLQGRQFLRERDSLGGALVGVRAGSGTIILGTVPENAMGGTAEVAVVGTGLSGLSAAEGTVSGITETPSGVRATVTGSGTVTLIAAGTAQDFTFFDAADRLTVEPSFTIARVGGGSEIGPDVVPAAFQAIAWANGPDGLAETEDDIRIGAVPAEWSVANANETAEAMRDAEYAGSIGKDGIFMPGPAGPNPERPFSTNNAGELRVTGSALGLSGEAHLIVTVQRFVDPPIR